MMNCSLPPIGWPVPGIDTQDSEPVAMQLQSLDSPFQYIQCTSETKDSFTEHLNIISQLLSGQTLLDQLNTLAQNTGVNVNVVNGEALTTSEISRNSSTGSLEINITLPKNPMQMECPVLFRNLQDQVEVQPLRIPYEIAVAHELIHVAHKLELLPAASEITDESLMSANRWEGLSSARSALKRIVTSEKQIPTDDDSESDSWDMEENPKWTLFLDLFGDTKAFEEYRTITRKNVNENSLINLKFSERHLLSDYYNRQLGTQDLFYVRWGHFDNFTAYHDFSNNNDTLLLINQLLSQQDIQKLPTLF
jgi:hypothetical protein